MATALLIAALVLPVALFWRLASRARVNAWVAVAVSVAAGWALNMAWASAAGESVAIATRFGWACPAVLVGLAWVAMRFRARRG